MTADAIKRYDFSNWGTLDHHPEGPFVHYADHVADKAAEVAALREALEQAYNFFTNTMGWNEDDGMVRACGEALRSRAPLNPTAGEGNG